MKLTLLIVLAVAELACVCGEESSFISKLAKHPKHNLFREFKKKFGKQYQETSGKDTVHDRRFGQFLRTLAKIDELNLSPDGAQFGITQFSDWTEEEFKKLLTFDPSQLHQSQKRYLANPQEVTTLRSAQSWNWCDQISGGCVIKDQGQCGSCWAHASTTAAETAIALAQATPIVQLAQQQLIDCYTSANGCDGGPVALDYIQRTGLPLLSNYPATSSTSGNQGSCQGPMQPAVPSQFAWGQYSSNSEEDMSQAVAGNAPFVALVDATNWNSYTGGIMSASQCAGSQLNHAVTVVGFNKDEGSWLIQNSWGTYWGEKGFIRIQFGANACLFQLGGVAIVPQSASPSPNPPYSEPTPTPTPEPTPIDDNPPDDNPPDDNPPNDFPPNDFPPDDTSTDGFVIPPDWIPFFSAQETADQNAASSTSPEASLSSGAYLGIGAAVGVIAAALVALIIVAIIKARSPRYEGV